MKNKIMVVIAHPDDESFPIGGTLAKYSSEGSHILLIAATRGEAGIADQSPEETAIIRETELRQAAKYLGISRVIFLDYLDGKLHLADEEEAVRKMKEIIIEEQPDVIITFGADGISGHPDHVAIHHITTEAFHRSGVNGRLFYIMPS
jgi:LmbE family N-acetylglucosaminyl deacetylase